LPASAGCTTTLCSAALDAVGQVGLPSAVVVGMITAPSFITASIDSHSSTWLPSIEDHPVAAATP
jgi:hypothetical protein